jgi:hypothetical protein
MGHDHGRSPAATTSDDGGHGVRRCTQATNGVTGLFLYDTNTRTKVALTNDKQIVSTYPSYTVIAEAGSPNLIVRFYHSQANYRNEDGPLAGMCGKYILTGFKTCDFLQYGRHTVTATAFSYDNGMGMQVGPPVTLTFTIVPPCGTYGASLVKYINMVTLSKKKLSLSGTTPLDRALQYLVSSNKSPRVQLDTCIQADKDRLYQRFAYLALVFSAGKDLATDWYDDANECQWTGVSCTGKTITGLALNRQGLQGSIPDDVGLWTGLTTFDVGSNQLGGSLPSSIGSWTNVTYVDVHDNRLSGTIPNDVSQWKSITEASFSHNTFVGSMPRSFCEREWCPTCLYADCKFDCPCCYHCAWH